MNSVKYEKSLLKQLKVGVGRRLGIAIFLVAFLSAGLHLTWTIYQRHVLKHKLSNALANTLKESIDDPDLVTIKSTIKAFEMANENTKICVKTGDEIIGEPCGRADFQEYTTPLTGQKTYVSIEMPPVDMMVYAGILFVFAALVILLEMRKYLRVFSFEITSDLESLLSGSKNTKFYFQELSKAKEKIIEAVRLTKENTQMKTQAAIGEHSALMIHNIENRVLTLRLATEDLIKRSPSELAEVMRMLRRLEEKVCYYKKENQRIIQRSEQPPADFHIDLKGRLSSEPLSTLVEQIVSDKKREYQTASKISIKSDVDLAGGGLFSRVEPLELESILSNLINNAIEAIKGTGTVLVQLRSEDELVKITVQDTGKGISPEILPTLMKFGASIGKKNGSGLGLSHAKKMIERWGGRIALESELQKGTTVTVLLPRAQPPDWFVNELILLPESHVVVLDDDALIHDVWKIRFSSLNITAHYFFKPNELSAWHAEHGKLTTTYFIDHDLGDRQATGPAIIKELGIEKQSILVTGRAYEDGVREACLNLGIRLIAKTDIDTIPITVTKPQILDAVFIDDDRNYHQSWQRRARSYSKKIKTYFSVHEFLTSYQSVDYTTPVFVDSELGDGQKGEVLSQDIFSAGFKTIYLATAHPIERFTAIPNQIKAIVSKVPPWVASDSV